MCACGVPVPVQPFFSLFGVQRGCFLQTSADQLAPPPDFGARGNAVHRARTAHTDRRGRRRDLQGVPECGASSPRCRKVAGKRVARAGRVDHLPRTPRPTLDNLAVPPSQPSPERARVHASSHLRHRRDRETHTLARARLAQDAICSCVLQRQFDRVSPDPSIDRAAW